MKVYLYDLRTNLTTKSTYRILLKNQKEILGDDQDA